MSVGAVNNTSSLMRYSPSTDATSKKTAVAATNFAAETEKADSATADTDKNTSSGVNTTAPTTATQNAGIGASSQSSDTNTSSTNASGTNATAPNADYNTFIKLLVAQMKNQDPTKPMDSTEFVSQLASFSAVEQQTQTNTKLDKMNSSLNNIMVDGPISRAEGYVGKYLSFKDEKGAVTEGTVQSVTIYSDGLIARLDNGKDLLIGPGVTVMNSKPKQA